MRDTRGTSIGEAVVCLAIVAVVVLMMSSLVSCGRQETEIAVGPTNNSAAMARAKAASDKSSCMNNLKECAIAVQLYWNDYDATLPSSALAGGDFETFGTKAGELPAPSGKQLRTWSQILYDHMKNKDIMWCPSDPTSRKNPNAPVSYWWKYAIDRAWNDARVMARKEGDFAYNADQVLLYEH